MTTVAASSAAEPSMLWPQPCPWPPVTTSFGSAIGIIDSVDGEPDGRITAINVRTGGFLGFGTKVVAVPEGKFQRTGSTVRIASTAEELSKLPAIKE